MRFFGLLERLLPALDGTLWGGSGRPFIFGCLINRFTI
jgi:hypothetical protein